MTNLKEKLERIFLDLNTEVLSLRTGRATPALVEDLPVDAYGTKQPLKALAAISIPEARQLAIQPWDKSVLPAVEKAIRTSPLGLNPVVDRDSIRLSLPTLTDDRKRDLIRVLKEKLEGARIQSRQARDAAMKSVEAEERAGALSEDEKFRRREEVEKVMEAHSTRIEELGAQKEREILAG